MQKGLSIHCTKLKPETKAKQRQEQKNSNKKTIAITTTEKQRSSFTCGRRRGCEQSVKQLSELTYNAGQRRFYDKGLDSVRGRIIRRVNVCHVVVKPPRFCRGVRVRRNVLHYVIATSVLFDVIVAFFRNVMRGL